MQTHDDAAGTGGEPAARPAVGAVPPGRAEKAEEYPRVFARVSRPLRDGIEALRDALRSPVDGSRANTSEVVRQLVVAGYVLFTDRELLDEALALKRELGVETMDALWREVLIAGLGALRKNRPGP